MWRKPDAKPSSGTSNAPSSIPPRTQPQPEPQVKKSEIERPAAAPAIVERAAEPVAPQASTISAGLKIRGEISGSSDLYLDGEANGKIRLNGARVTIGPKGKVQADIEAREIVVNGELQGNLKAADRLRLGASSHVQGSLSAPSVGIDDGARFRGSVEVTRKQVAPVAKPETKPQTKQESKSEPQPETKSQAKPETKPESSASTPAPETENQPVAANVEDE